MNEIPTTRVFPALPIGEATTRKQRVRICIVSPEFVGPSNNGGIGTAYTAMADALAEAGFEVTCLYSKGTECATQDIAHWVAQFRARKLTLVPLPKAAVPIDGVFYSLKSYEVYHWLKQHDHFDFVHVPEWQGLGYHSQMAKRQGLAFARTRFCIGLHSMTEWLKYANREYVTEPVELQLDHMERQSVALADVVVSPSRYLLEWIHARGWELPAASYVQQNIMPRSAFHKAGTPQQGSRTINELVFFGRLETRKGVQLFCEALDRLPAEVAAKVTRVTFLGKDAMVENATGESYVQKRAHRWSWPVQFLKDRNQPQALEYLRGEGRLAVIPSLIENSPYTVLECIGAGIAFAATRVGGIPELISSADVDEVCFEPKPEALAGRLRSALEHGFRAARGSIDAESNKLVWLAWHARQAESPLALPPAKPVSWPKVSLCMTTFNRPGLLSQALESVRALRYPNLEVVLVDDGSTQSEAQDFLEELAPEFTERGWQIVRQSNRYLGAARNTGVRHSTGELLLFMDDDNYAEPHELTVLVQALMRSNADIMCCGMNYFSGFDAPDRNASPKGRWLPIGGAASAGAFLNCFGDANALVRRSCFEAVGGFTEDYGVTHEDWEFHAKAVLKGFKLQVVPEFLFWYRANNGSMLRSLAPYPNHMRSIRPYLDAVPPELRNLVLFAHGSAIQTAANGSGAAWAHYSQLTIQWRSKLEAGLALLAMGEETAAARQMLAAVKAVESCKHPRVLLESLMEVSTHLGRLDPGRTRVLLGFAIQIADNMQRAEEKERAQVMLAGLAEIKPAAVRERKMAMSVG